jgi:hypothetical protein
MRKPDTKRPLGRPRSRWRYYIKVVLRESGRGWGGMDWTDLAQMRHQMRAPLNIVMNLWVS